MDFKNKLPFTVGALLYCPAINESIGNSVVKENLGNKYSLALCLEDTINDFSLEYAENQLAKTIKFIHKKREEEKTEFYLPKIFIRVRTPLQILKIINMIKPADELITGFICPKFSKKNSTDYINSIIQINYEAKTKKYMMPIMEDTFLMDIKKRATILFSLKEELDTVKEFVLNIRTGGNDLCNTYALRRHIDETIYDIQPIANILSDILSVFAKDYVVSGCVWEYFNSKDDKWKNGLEKELKLDILNGFIGKTVIHPKQIDTVNESIKVSNEDYNDALNILGWDKDLKSLVSKGEFSGRMNEYKTHFKWAEKIILLSQIYGIKN